MVEALAELGVEFDGISQTEQYTSGVYREQILHAMKHRGDIDAILDQYRTKKAPAKKQSQKPVDEAELEAAEGSGAAAEDDGSSGSAGYFPYKPYCGDCGKDLTTVTAYDDDTTELAYTCTACGFSETVRLSEFNRGKLVWKVDWPMRWAYEGVVFEPSGVDHSSPGLVASRSAGRSSGSSAASSRSGRCTPSWASAAWRRCRPPRAACPRPADALKIMEPQLLRWLYARRRPNQSFKIAFDQEIQRLYDEWDKLDAKVADGSALPADVAAHSRAVGTAAGELPRTPRPLPYRTLASVADITAGAEDQTLRILSELDPENPLTSLDEVRPRLDKAEAWINTQVPADQRTIVRDEPDAELLKSLDEQGRAVAAAAARRPRLALVPRRAHAPRLRRAQGPGRVLRRRHAQGAAAGDQGRPADVLRPALPPAGRPGHRAAAAHAAARGGRRTGCGSCSAAVAGRPAVREGAPGDLRAPPPRIARACLRDVVLLQFRRVAVGEAVDHARRPRAAGA